MDSRVAEQLLYDSEATLRLVDTLLDELQVMEPEDGFSVDAARPLSIQMERTPGGVADPTDLLSHACTEVREVLDGLSQTRAVLERTTLDKLQLTGERSDVPTAADLRDGLERAIALVVGLDLDRPTDVRTELREELLQLLHFARAQEITEQQISYLSGALRDSESRLCALSQEIGPAARPSGDASAVIHDIFRRRPEI